MLHHAVDSVGVATEYVQGTLTATPALLATVVLCYMRPTQLVKEKSGCVYIDAELMIQGVLNILFTERLCVHL